MMFDVRLAVVAALLMGLVVAAQQVQGGPPRMIKHFDPHRRMKRSHDHHKRWIQGPSIIQDDGPGLDELDPNGNPTPTTSLTAPTFPPPPPPPPPADGDDDTTTTTTTTAEAADFEAVAGVQVTPTTTEPPEEAVNETAAARQAARQRFTPPAAPAAVNEDDNNVVAAARGAAIVRRPLFTPPGS